MKTKAEWEMKGRLVKDDATPYVDVNTSKVLYKKKDTYKFFNQQESVSDIVTHEGNYFVEDYDMEYFYNKYY